MKMIFNKSWKKKLTAVLSALCISSTFCSFAMAATPEEIEAEIKRQQEYLAQLETQKTEAENTTLKNQISDLTAQVRALNAEKQQRNTSFDAEKSFNELNGYFWNMYDQWVAEKETIAKLIETVDKLAAQVSETHSAATAAKAAAEQQREERAAARQASRETYDSSEETPSYQRGALVNPGPTKSIGYTQDAANAQGHSTMTFRYTETQLYKIYCRAGYLTDIQLHKGESINFVGGGDSSSWSVTSAVVGDTAHLYIKPVVETGTTNLIITTNKRSYQLILEAGDWYNPMVRWTYDEEALQNSLLRQKKDEQTVTDNLAVSYDQLNFNYSVKKNTAQAKPIMIFDDTEKTIIKFKHAPKNAPAIFVKEPGRKGVNMVNFKIKDNCYILDRIADTVELRYNDYEITTIARKGTAN